MKRLCLPLLCFLVALSSTVAEQVFDSLADTKTDFEITFSNSPVVIQDQGITLRSVADQVSVKNSSGELETATITYRSYHLEFAFTHRFKRKEFSEVEFYRGNDLVHRLSIKDPSRRITTSNVDRYEVNYLAINLQGVPLIMLDSVDRINFRK